MRIAYVCADAGVPIFGRKGCSVHVQEMLRAFQRRGAGVDVFAARVDEAPPSGLESLQVHHLTPVGDGDPSSHAAAIAASDRKPSCQRDGDQEGVCRNPATNASLLECEYTPQCEQ